MAGAAREADAVGIMVRDLQTGETRAALRAETDWEHSPASLCWSADGERLLFTADVRSRKADVTTM
jgi:hypothetical protein